jgi:HD-GYP domain-containing protein (c-di-GMP phosphodiesterase class II)
MSDFVPIKLKTLPVDITLECEIYFRKTGDSDEKEMALLCENQTLSQERIDRFKRAIFPEAKVYIDRQCVITHLFENGHFIGYSPNEVEDIKNGESPWKKKRANIPPSAPKIIAKPKSAPPPLKTESNADFHKEKFKKQSFEQVVKEYDETKSVTEGMLNTVAETGKIDKEQGSQIAQNVQTQIDKTDVSMIIQTINRIRTADEYMHTHCLNVAFLNGLMGKWLKFDPVRQNEIVEVGLFHDIGKLEIDQAILHKAGKLTKEEFELIKSHPVLSMEVLIKSGIRNKAILEGVVQHHERVNGTGYPKGLDTKEICEYARITAISDVYDAMVTKRNHKDSHSPFTILHEFAQGGYSELDIKYVNTFVDCMVEELKGKEIIMSDGREAVVLLVSPRRLLYPIVEIEGKVVMTNEELYCVRMKEVLD